MDSTFVIFLVTFGVLMTVFGILFYMGRNYSSKKEREKKLRDIKRIRAMKKAEATR